MKTLYRPTHSSPGRRPGYSVVDTAEIAAQAFLERWEWHDVMSSMVLLLDIKLGLISTELVSVGSLTETFVIPRDVFRKAVSSRHVARIIVGSNHPSGSVIPSLRDLDVAHRLREAGQVIGIDVDDYIVLTEDGSFRSIARGGWPTESWHEEDEPDAG